MAKFYGLYNLIFFFAYRLTKKLNEHNKSQKVNFNNF